MNIPRTGERVFINEYEAIGEHEAIGGNWHQRRIARKLGRL